MVFGDINGENLAACTQEALPSLSRVRPGYVVTVTASANQASLNTGMQSSADARHQGAGSDEETQPVLTGVDGEPAEYGGLNMTDLQGYG